jgi:hypothetical protein
MKAGERKPYKIDTAQTEALQGELDCAGIAVPKGWTMFVTDTRRGRCYTTKHCFTVPTWAIKKSWAYAIYYACHEMAHINTPRVKGNVHGAAFMAEFIRLCPDHLQHHELGYKPRLAAAAGITKEEANK